MRSLLFILVLPSIKVIRAVLDPNLFLFRPDLASLIIKTFDLFNGDPVSALYIGLEIKAFHMCFVAHFVFTCINVFVMCPWNILIIFFVHTMYQI